MAALALSEKKLEVATATNENNEKYITHLTNDISLRNQINLQESNAKVLKNTKKLVIVQNKSLEYLIGISKQFGLHDKDSLRELMSYFKAGH